MLECKISFDPIGKPAKRKARARAAARRRLRTPAARRTMAL
ncbi:hypothetical protein OH687_14295 [Burkholderia anthina]|nr:hypothetical protein OH687_14295 [Burkholderia anthina]